MSLFSLLLTLWAEQNRLSIWSYVRDTAPWSRLQRGFHVSGPRITSEYLGSNPWITWVRILVQEGCTKWQNVYKLCLYSMTLVTPQTETRPGVSRHQPIPLSLSAWGNTLHFLLLSCTTECLPRSRGHKHVLCWSLYTGGLRKIYSFDIVALFILSTAGILRIMHKRNIQFSL